MGLLSNFKRWYWRNSVKEGSPLDYRLNESEILRVLRVFFPNATVKNNSIDWNDPELDRPSPFEPDFPLSHLLNEIDLAINRKLGELRYKSKMEKEELVRQYDKTIHDLKRKLEEAKQT